MKGKASSRLEWEGVWIEESGALFYYYFFEEEQELTL